MGLVNTSSSDCFVNFQVTRQCNKDSEDVSRLISVMKYQIYDNSGASYVCENLLLHLCGIVLLGNKLV